MSWKSRALAAEAELRGEKTERLKEALFKAQDGYNRGKDVGGSFQRQTEITLIHAEANLREHLDIPGNALWQPPNRYRQDIHDWSY